MLENNQKKYDDKINNIFDSAQSIQGASRPLNKPRQVIVTGSPTFPEKEQTKASENQENISAEKSNTIDDLAKETNAIANVKDKNFFMKFINKIKAMLIKK